MRAQLSLFVMLVAASPAMAQNREDFDAAAALALQVAIQPTSPRLPATLTLAEAKEFARSRRAPVLVRVGGLDCAALCAKLRPDFASCHADELAGERSPDMNGSSPNASPSRMSSDAPLDWRISSTSPRVTT